MKLAFVSKVVAQYPAALRKNFSRDKKLISSSTFNCFFILCTPWMQMSKRRSEDEQDVSWAYVHSIYVLCPGVNWCWASAPPLDLHWYFLPCKGSWWRPKLRHRWSWSCLSRRSIWRPRRLWTIYRWTLKLLLIYVRSIFHS